MPISSSSSHSVWFFSLLKGGVSDCKMLISASSSSVQCCSPLALRPIRYAVLGAGFAGISVAWHLLNLSPKELNLKIDIYDEVGIGGGASGVSGGLLHPYSPKVKLLWKGAECWNESLMLLGIAERAALSKKSSSELAELGQGFDGFIVRRRGILRPATSVNNLNVLFDNAQNCYPSCRVEIIDDDSSQRLVPNLCLPFNSAFYMPEAVNVHPLRYLQALFLACENLVKESYSSRQGRKELYLHKKSVQTLSELEGNYDAVVICLGAKADMIHELSGKLPLRTCRGVIAHLQLPCNIREEYQDYAPSILADAWLSVQGSRSLYMGSTWEWKSRNCSPNVPADEASKALQELLPKVCAFYPGIKDWVLAGARAGLRAMPPLTTHGSLPVLGCVNDFVGKKCASKYWLFTGLGSRGLLYHAFLGKLMAQAMLSCNEDLLPAELTCWKNVNR